MVEAPATDAQGRVRWFESVKSPLFNERAEVIGTVGIARDITGRKQAESLLQAQRDLGVNLEPDQRSGCGPEALAGNCHADGRR